VRNIFLAAIVASISFFAITHASAQQRQTWYAVEDDVPHWYTEVYVDNRLARFDAIRKEGGVMYTISFPCGPDQPGQVAFHVYAPGEVMGTMRSCAGEITSNLRHINYWLQQVGRFPQEVLVTLR